MGCPAWHFPALPPVGLAVGRVQSDQVDALFVKPVEDVVQLDLIDDLNVQHGLITGGLDDETFHGFGCPLVDFAMDHDLVPDRPTSPL